MPFTASRLAKLKPAKKGERLIYHDDRRSTGKLRIVCSETGCRYFYAGKSRITMEEVGKTSPEEGEIADGWHKLELQGVKSPHKLSGTVSGSPSGQAIITATRARVDRLMAAGKLRQATAKSMLQMCNQAEKESWSIALVPVEQLTPELVMEWFTTAVKEKGVGSTNKRRDHFQTTFKDLQTLSVIPPDVENPFAKLSQLGLTQTRNRSAKNPISLDRLGEFVHCLTDCDPDNRHMNQRFLMFFLLHTGLRPDTVYRMRIEHVDFESSLLKIPQHKTAGQNKDMMDWSL